MITYCSPTYRSFDLCAKSIEAVMQGSYIPDRIIVKDDSGEGAALPAILDLSQKYPLDIIISPKRDGVAKSWNRLIQESTGAQYIIIANDDIAVHENTIHDLVYAADTTPTEMFFAGAGASGNAFSLFLLRRTGYEQVGPFDERFFPAYFEDNDYDERMRRAGYHIQTVQSAVYDHVGSATIAHYTPAELSQHHEQFRANRDYFRFKWGGLPGQTTYQQPFNGKI